MENDNNQNKKEEEATSTEIRSTQVPQNKSSGEEEISSSIIFYKPALVKEDPLPLATSELSYAPKLLQASRDGLIPVRLEEDVIIQRISHDLYSDPKSGFRELYNNEARACRIAMKNHPGARPRIQVTVSPSARRLAIHGIDSMGMSQQKFLAVYTVLGRSDNFDSSEVGQFGLGRAAYTCLSDIMVLETYSRETGEKYAVMGKNGIGYNLLPQPADLDQYGTRITITLREDIDLADLVRYAFEVCRFSGVETQIELEEDIDDGYYYYNNNNSSSDLRAGQYRTGLESMKEHLAGLRAKNGDEERLLLAVEIDDDRDLYLYGEIIAFKASYEDEYSRILDKGPAGAYLVNVPIGGDLGDLPLSRWIVNVKDERKYPPTADRERLTDAAAIAIREKIVSALKEKLSSALKLESLQDYIRSPCRMVYTTGTYSNNSFPERLLPLLDDRTREVAAFVNTRVRVLRRMKRGRKCRAAVRIADLLSRDGAQPLFQVRNVRSAAADALRENVFSCEVFEADPGSSAELMARFGVKDGDLYVKENGLKRTTACRAPDTITAYRRRGHFTETMKIRVGDIMAGDDGCRFTSDRIIAVSREQRDGYLALMEGTEESYLIVVCGENDSRKKKALAGRCTPLADFVAATAKKVVTTSMGRMAAAETLERARDGRMDVALLVYDDPHALAESLKGDGTDILSIVVPDEDSRYELKVFYRYHGISGTLGWSDAYGRAGRSGLPGELETGVIAHANAAFGARYPELIELLAHAVVDRDADALRLRDHAFSLASRLDRCSSGSGCTAEAAGRLVR